MAMLPKKIERKSITIISEGNNGKQIVCGKWEFLLGAFEASNDTEAMTLQITCFLCRILSC